MVQEYNSWFNKYGDDHRSVGWNKPKQQSRFETLLSFWQSTLTNHQNIGKKTVVLDIGCGLAHFNKFIKLEHPTVNYAGIDVNPSFIEKNRISFPDDSFILTDYSSKKFSADISFASGLFNRKFHDSKEFFANTIKKMIMESQFGCSFNFLSTLALRKYEKNYYVSLQDVERIIDRKLVAGLLIDGISIPGEITVHISKKL